MNPAPFEVPGLHTAALVLRDAALVQDLLERCAEFQAMVEGEPPRADEAARLFRDLPSCYDERCIVGLVAADGARLAGLLDVIGGYPARGAWWVGLLLLAPEERGRGIGAGAYRAFEAWARARGAREVGLVVQQQNPEARRVWDRLGFVEVGAAVQRLARRENAVWRMRRLLGAPR
ncbi:MAG: GNAT family N-acetyltransferase [Anaeromyxobacteraceae bacterium]